MDYEKLTERLIYFIDQLDKRDWLLYDLLDLGYDSDELLELGFWKEEIETMSDRLMHGLGPE
jgi:hypothetical protein